MTDRMDQVTTDGNFASTNIHCLTNLLMANLLKLTLHVKAYNMTVSPLQPLWAKHQNCHF